MKKIIAIAALLGMCIVSVAAGIERVEPLSWWTGMKTPLQLMVNGEGIGAFGKVTVEGGKGLKVKAVHKADSPNYLFVDMEVAAKAKPGTYTLVFSNGAEELRYPYLIEARTPGSADRESFSTADLIYLIVPDRFANGDPENDSTSDTAEKADRGNPMGRHGGDIQGIIDHLDYIADLGATALWSTPLLGSDNRRGSYHGYACTDYYHIDPRYGSNELYREMVNVAHSRGIKVILDVVTNHSSTSHWWMRDLPFKDWVHVSDPYVNTNHTFSLGMDPNAAKSDIAIMEEGWFVPGMPDMNLDNPFMLRYFQQWAVWWIEYSGLDGFRVDTYFYNEKVPMSQWCAAVRSEYTKFNIVGECWSSNPDMIAYWQAGNPNNDGFNSNLPSVMDFPLRDAINNALTPPRPLPEGAPQGRVRRGGPDISAVYNALGHDFVYHDLSHMLLFLSNHDTARIGDIFGEDVSRMKIALTLLATMRGIPQLFYGDELMFTIGSPRRDDGRLRMDFPGGWEGDSVDLFTAEGRLAASADSTWAHAPELHEYARTLFNWRKGSSAVQNGKTLHFIPQDNTYGYFRYDDAETVFVFINNSDVEVKLPWSRFKEMSSSLEDGLDVLSGKICRLSDETTVAPKSSLVIEYKL